MKYLLSILFLTFISCSFAQNKDNIKVKGFVDTYHAFRTDEPNDFLASCSRFRGELEKLNGKSYFFASLNAVHNNVLPELTQISFREAYMEYTADNWGFKAGRQIIIWGKADGLKITDVIAPMDLTEFLAQDYDDIRMPVNALTVSKFGNNWDLDLVCIPVFEASILPGEDNPWGTPLGEGVVIDEAQFPEFSFSNMEYGAKLSFYLSGIDFDLSLLNSWNKAPVYNYYTDEATSEFHIVPEHHRFTFVGFGFSKSLSAFVLRGENAFYFDKMFSPSMENTEMGLFEKNSINYLIGIDWYPGNEWTISGQFSNETILDYSLGINNKEHTSISTLSVSKKIFHSTLSISSFAYVDLNNNGFFNRTSCDYSVSDNIHVLAGFDWFYGDKGVFNQYEDNSQIWVKAKYNF